MPRRYVRKVNRRSRRIAKRPWYSRKYTPLGLAKKALAGVWKLKGLVNSEKYKFDLTGFLNPTSAGLVTHLTPVAQGDGDGNRTGNSIFCRSLNGRLILDRDTAGLAPNCQLVKVAIVIDTQQIGDTSPSFSTIYENNNVIAHINNETAGRFKILYTRVFKVDSDDPKRYLEINLPMRHHVRFNGTGGGDIQKGGIYMVTVGDNATYAPTLTYEWRLSYHDN